MVGVRRLSLMVKNQDLLFAIRRTGRSSQNGEQKRSQSASTNHMQR